LISDPFHPPAIGKPPRIALNLRFQRFGEPLVGH
jgi:hypothetical protein